MLQQTISKLVGQSKAPREFKWQNGTDMDVIILMKFNPESTMEQIRVGQSNKGGTEDIER